MNSVTPWMKAGTPEVVTVMEGAPIWPAAAPPAPPRRELRKWPRSEGISWGWGSLVLVSVGFWADAEFAVGGGVGPEAEKEKEVEEEVV